MISDIEHDFPQKSCVTSKGPNEFFLITTLEKTHLGLLTETHEVLLRLIKTPNIDVFKMAAPTEDCFPQTIF